LRPVATSDVLVVSAVKLAVPRGAEVTVKVSPTSIDPPIVIVDSCVTGITESEALVVTTETSAAVQLKPTVDAVVSIKDGAVVNVAFVPDPETTNMP